MKKSCFLIVLGCFFAVFCSAKVHYLTTEEFKEKVMDYTKYTPETGWIYKGKKPWVIDFYTTWCGPCKRLAPIMDALSDEYEGKVDFYKVDTEKEQELAYFFQIRSIPQVLYVPVKGDPSLRMGLYPQEDIVQIINTFLLPSKK